MTQEQRQVCESAIREFGTNRQTLKLFEEMAELQEAICKSRDLHTEKKDIITKIADVRIMVEQMAIIYGRKEVEQEINRKIDRLAQHRKERQQWRAKLQTEQ